MKHSKIKNALKTLITNLNEYNGDNPELMYNLEQLINGILKKYKKQNSMYSGTLDSYDSKMNQIIVTSTDSLDIFKYFIDKQITSYSDIFKSKVYVAEIYNIVDTILNIYSKIHKSNKIGGGRTDDLQRIRTGIDETTRLYKENEESNKNFNIKENYNNNEKIKIRELLQQNIKFDQDKPWLYISTDSVIKSRLGV
jgi:hypothetical protein